MYEEVTVSISDPPPLGEALLDDLEDAIGDTAYRATRHVTERYRRPRALYGAPKEERLDVYCGPWAWAPLTPYVHDPDIRVGMAAKAPVGEEFAVEVREDRYGEVLDALADLGLEPAAAGDG